MTNVMTDKEVLEKCLWIARDLSIKLNGRVPSVVTDSPAALNRIEAELTRLRQKYVNLGQVFGIEDTIRERDEAIAALRGPVHNHGPHESPGLGCHEYKVGACIADPLLARLSTPKEPTDD